MFRAVGLHLCDAGLWVYHVPLGRVFPKRSALGLYFGDLVSLVPTYCFIKVGHCVRLQSTMQHIGLPVVLNPFNFAFSCPLSQILLESNQVRRFFIRLALAVCFLIKSSLVCATSSI